MARELGVSWFGRWKPGLIVGMATSERRGKPRLYGELLVVAGCGGHDFSTFRIANQGWLWRQLIELDFVDMARQAQFLQRPDAVPVHVDFIPFQSMARGNRVRVVIVVPALAEGDERNQEIVG
jgi:hypothetical protein